MREDCAGIAFPAGGFHAEPNSRTIDEQTLGSVFGADSLKAGVDAGFICDIYFGKDTADFGGNLCAALCVHIENADFHAFSSKGARCRFAETGGAAGDDGCDFAG